MSIVDKNIEKILENEEKIYLTEYNMMMKNFQKEETRTDFFKKINNKQKNINEEWKNRVYKIKQKTEEDNKEQFNRKRESTIIQIKPKTKSSFLTELSSRLKSCAKTSQTRLESNASLLENERIDLKRIIEERQDTLLKNSLSNKLKIKSKFEQKNYSSSENFHRRYKTLMNLNEINNQKKTEKSISKFENWYVNHYQKNFKMIKEKRNLTQENSQRKKEHIKLLNELKEKEIEEKYEKIKLDEKQRSISKDIYNENIKSNFFKFEDKFRKILVFKNNEKNQNFMRNNEILDKQITCMKKSKTIEDLLFQNRTLSYEKQILKNMESEKKIKIFLRKLTSMKSRDLIKKSNEEKKKMYLDMKKKKEEELRKKLAEEQKKITH